MNHYCDNAATKQIISRLGYALFCAFLVQTSLAKLYANEYQAVKKPAYGLVLKPVNVRQKPSTAYKIVGKLEKGDKLKVLGRYKKEWYHVMYKHKKAWVWSKNMRLKPIKTKTNQTKKPAANLEVIKYPHAQKPKSSLLDNEHVNVYDRYRSYPN
ncbi:SH3 domain-containing protein [bacterium]|nr:SH3 domain-containing protein [bacterium]